MSSNSTGGKPGQPIESLATVVEVFRKVFASGSKPGK
jgi:hypothetical protein